MGALMMGGSLLGALVVRRLLESRNGLTLAALGTVSRGWISSQLKRAEMG
jgi:hypothetical protein